MKNIKFIPLFLIAFSLMISSCAIDDDDAIIPTGTIVTASLNRTGDIFVFDGNDITLDFVLSRALSAPTLFSYTLNGVENSINLDSGDTSVSLSIPNVVGVKNTIVLTEASALNLEYVSVGTTNNKVTFIGVPAVIPGFYNVLVDLEGASFALSLGRFNATGVWQSDPLGFTFDPTFSLPVTTTIANSSDISPEYYAIDIFPTTSLDTPNYTVYVVGPDSTVSVFSGENLNQSSFVDNDVIIVGISDDPLNAGDKIYTFTQN